MDTGAAFTGGAGNDTFKATGKTLTALDSLDGAGGVNTLDVQDADAVMGTTLPAGVVLKNIQKLNVNTAGALGQVTAVAAAAQKEIDTLTFTAANATSTSTLAVGELKGHQKDTHFSCRRWCSRTLQ